MNRVFLLFFILNQWGSLSKVTVSEKLPIRMSVFQWLQHVPVGISRPLPWRA